MHGYIIEDTSGYTFYWSGLPASGKTLHGVGLAIKTSLTKRLRSLPKAINERLTMLRLPVSKDRYVTVTSAYVPTMSNDETTKEKFYSYLEELLRLAPKCTNVTRA